jgi:hypothetical protein
MLFALLAAAPARAFCGTYVAGAGVEITNSTSQVAVVRQGTRTTLTLANDFDGAVGEFALVVPVPVVLEADDVRVLDPAVFERLDTYSGPRLVDYTCDDLYPASEVYTHCGQRVYGYSGRTVGPPDFGAVDPVQVASRFIVGEYDVVVLTAHASMDLLQWLSDQGFAVSPAAADAIQEYLDRGSYFLAAKVDPDQIPEGQAQLSPLQVSYESDAFGLPIRLGTVNAVDAQDVVVYAITPGLEGRVGISNYPQATLDSVCLWPDDGDFADFYADRVAGALDSTDQAHWMVEYAWTVSPWAPKCDPCPASPEGVDPLPAADLVALGMEGELGVDTQGDTGGYVRDFTFTRLRMRYTPEQATQDLALYSSGILDNTQQRYVRHAPHLEWDFPMCDGGWIDDDPGSCADLGVEYRDRMQWGSSGGRDGAARAGVLVGVLGLLGLLAGRRRNKRPC